MNDNSFIPKGRRITLSSSHVYMVDGRIVESVTQAIGRAGLDPNKNFYNEIACKRGVDIHKMLEYYDLGTLDISSVSKAYQPYLKAYILFCRFSKPIWNIDGVEQTFYNEEYDFCGTRDRVGSILWNGKRVDCVLDLKSGAKASWHKVQLAGYSIDVRYKVERFGLYVKKNGSYELEHYTDDSDFETFKNILKEK